MKKFSRYTKALFLILISSLVLNLLAGFRGLADFYAAEVYPVISEAFTRVTDLLPFALGEVLMYVGMLLLIGLAAVLLLLLFLRKKEGYRRFAKGYVKGFGMLLAVTLLVYTLCWSIPIRSDLIRLSCSRQYTVEDLRRLREEIVTGLNAAAEEVERDESGRIIYGDDVDAQVAEAMQRLGRFYPNLRGYYPQVKAAWCSNFLEWMWIGGYTYPYTMEVTYNRYITDLYYPMLSAHELSHHKGFYKENEANFISFLACSKSDTPLLRYSAYKDIYYYVDNAYWDSLMQVMSRERALEVYSEEIMPAQVVAEDERAAQEVADERYDTQANKDMEVFSDYASQVADVGWDTQTELLQEAGYDGVVALLLEYYNRFVF